MKLTHNKNLIFSLAAVVIFMIIALVYNSPVLSGNKAISQPDIVNYKGSAHEMDEFRAQTGEETYWSDAMFGGMPTYQTGAKYAGNWIQKLDNTLRFLPRPADYVFLLFIGFFILGLVLFKNWKYAILGSALFAMGTYFFIIIAAGHNSKVHAVAYFAPLMAGIILLFRQKYIWGFILTTLFMALELVANHPQMTYYFGFVVLFYIIFEGIDQIKNGKIKPLIISASLALGAVVLALGMNASHLIPTYEYGQNSTRGKNDLSLIEGQNQNGLDSDYITGWSYGKLETLNLFIPNFMGGGSTEPDTNKKNLRKNIQSNAQSQEEANYMEGVMYMFPTYWGEQPFTSGPAYQGAVVILLFVLGLFFVRGKYKWWLLSATIFSILLAWGKNFNFLTDFFIDYVPLYDKFRAVSSMLVVAEFTIPLLAIWGIYEFFTNKSLTDEFKKKILYYGGGFVVGFLLFIYLFGKGMFGFHAASDQMMIAQGAPQYLIDGIVADRVDMFKSDVLRTLAFVVITLALLIAYQFKYIQQKNWVILAIAILSIIDFWGVDKRYLNDENFINKQWVKYPFPTEVNNRMYQEAQGNPTLMQIVYKVPYNKMLDSLSKSNKEHFRVYNTISSTFDEANTSYFVPSVGGYHGAKMQTIQNVIDLFFVGDSSMQKKYGLERKQEYILNLLNTQYIAVGDYQRPQLMPNPGAYGNAWFVNKVNSVASANDAVVEMAKSAHKEMAVVEGYAKSQNFELDSTQNIRLKKYEPNQLVYESNNAKNGFAVFSEMFYNKGWKATIDGVEAPIFKTNYFLRGMEVPAGKHEIVFSFEPASVQTGNSISIASNILFLLVLLGGAYLGAKQSSNRKI